jgi:hypothetical protein
MPPRTTIEPAHQNPPAPPVNQQQAPVYQAPPVPAKSSGPILILALAGVLALAGAGGGYYYWSSHKTETKAPPPPIVKPTDTTTTAPSSVTDTKGTTPPLDGGKIKRDPKPERKPVTTRTTDTSIGPIYTPPPPPPPIKRTLPATSGTLVCSAGSTGMGKHGKEGYLFPNLPRHIRFVNSDFSSRWIIEAPRKNDTTQDLLLIPLSPHMPTSCAEPWVAAP